MLAALCVASVAALAYFVCGSSFEGLRGGAHYFFTAGGKPWDWLGAGPLFIRGSQLNGSPASLAILLEIFAVGLAALIPLGSAAERWRLGASCLSTALLAGVAFPLFAHWVWGGGWLAQLGTNYNLGSGFLDPGGSGVVQVVGGLAALCMAWILGPRRGKFNKDGMPTAMPGHSAVLVLFGCALALAGWLGLNLAGAILFANSAPSQSVLVALNTFFAAGSGALGAAFVTRIRFGKTDASLCANGWVSGLVASSAACAFIQPAEAIVVGMVAGALVPFSIELLELRMRVDDPGGAISVHLCGGLWGILAAGIFARIPGVSGLQADGQFMAQLVGLTTLLGVMLPLIYGMNWLLDRVYKQRVALEGERQGMDLFELGAGAYPDFMTHRDDFTLR